jgi:uncharacterized protein YabN with tetrapyrrole methylase and pyrophosphatase domain
MTKHAVHHSVLAGISTDLPPFDRAWEMIQRGASVGWKYPNIAGAIEKVDEELAEVKEAITSGNQRDIEDELGDLLHATIAVSMYANVRPIQAAQITNHEVAQNPSTVADALTYVDSQFAALKNVIKQNDHADIEAKINDLVRGITSIARIAHVDAECAIESTNRKWVKRFGGIEAKAHELDIPVSDMSFSEQLAAWNAAKPLPMDRKSL